MKEKIHSQSDYYPVPNQRLHQQFPELDQSMGILRQQKQTSFMFWVCQHPSSKKKSEFTTGPACSVVCQGVYHNDPQGNPAELFNQLQIKPEETSLLQNLVSWERPVWKKVSNWRPKLKSSIYQYRFKLKLPRMLQVSQKQDRAVPLMFQVTSLKLPIFSQGLSCSLSQIITFKSCLSSELLKQALPSGFYSWIGL